MATMSHGRAMAWLAERDPERVAIVHEDREVSRGALERRSNRLARAYAARGVGEGDLVTLALPNCVEFFEACLATWKLGAVPSPVPARLPKAERDAIVAEADPALVVGVEGEYGGRPCVPAAFEPGAEHSDAPLPDRTARHGKALASGGSTGRPKLVLDLTPAQCDPEVAPNHMTLGGVVIVPGPLHHAGPFITAFQGLFSGCRVVLMSRFDAARALALIERHRVDWVLFVPTMMQRIWKLPAGDREGYDVSSLRTVMCTGAASPDWLKRAWIEWIGPEKIREAYGGAERIGGTEITGTEWLAHPGSVGRPTAGRKLKIVDSDGKECPPGTVGEIYMMPPGGQGSTYRYLGASPRADAGGWESLGDLGYLDEDGYLYLADRRTDMIVTGGENVYPAEVEGAIDAHPAVLSSAVVGLPDDDLGQRVHAIVQARAPLAEEELLAHLAERLVRYKIPRSVEFMDEPLRDEAGKVRRCALREARVARRT